MIDTDQIARQVVQPGEAGLADVVARFGKSVLTTDGMLDRAAMRRLIFSDPVAKADLEAILHPLIGTEAKRQAVSAGGIYQIIVVPLLVGSPLLAMLDRVLVVDCDEATQIARLLARDAETEAQARRILASQASRKERLAIADDIIDNNHDKEDTARQVAVLDRRYRAICEYQRRSAE